MPPALRGVFGIVCGQVATHTWAPGGVILPLCQRCTGLYVGAAVALLAQRALRSSATTTYLTLNAVFLLQMIPLGYHWLPQGPLIRSASGVLFGFGLIAFLTAPLGASQPARTHAQAWYAAAIATALIAVPALAWFAGAPGAVLVTVLDAVGLVSLTLLALLVAIRIPATFITVSRS